LLILRLRHTGEAWKMRNHCPRDLHHRGFGERLARDELRSDAGGKEATARSQQEVFSTLPHDFRPFNVHVAGHGIRPADLKFERTYYSANCHAVNRSLRFRCRDRLESGIQTLLRPDS
jgi:hypothetical protein